MGYHQFNSVAEYRIALENAINDAMDNEIAYNAVLAMQDSIESNVYDAYDPKYNRRRMEGGGLIAKANLTPTYIPISKTLIIEAIAPWQNIGFITTHGMGTYGGDLSDVIENSGMYGAPPRPFAWFAEDAYSKRFARDLQHALIKRGL